VIGVFYLVFALPVALFAGRQDAHWHEIASLVMLLPSVLVASGLALFRRTWAGVLLSFVGAFSAVSLSLTTYQMLTIRASPIGYGEVLGGGMLGLVALAFGLFFLITGMRGWPELKPWQRTS
jgi:hypothetical protein